MAVTQVLATDSIDAWRTKTNTISTALGDTAALTTTSQNVVGGINELDNEQGVLSTLTTANKGNLVAAVNEIKTDLDNATTANAIPRPVLIAFA
jgi:hypothetical protein